MKISKRQLKQIIREEYTRLRIRKMLNEDTRNMSPYAEARSRFDSLAKLHAYFQREHGDHPRMYHVNSGYRQVLQGGRPPKNLSPEQKDMLSGSVSKAIENLSGMKEYLSQLGGLDGEVGEVRQVESLLRMARMYKDLLDGPRR